MDKVELILLRRMTLVPGCVDPALGVIGTRTKGFEATAPGSL